MEMEVKPLEIDIGIEFIAIFLCVSLIEVPEFVVDNEVVCCF